MDFSLQVSNLILQSTKIFKIKTPVTAIKHCWDRSDIPAVPPGLAQTAPPLRVLYNTLAFVYGEPCSVSHTPRLMSCFRSPSEVHSILSYSAAIAPPAALWRNSFRIYLLFFNGFLHCSTRKGGCQEFYQNLFSKQPWNIRRNNGMI